MTPTNAQRFFKALHRRYRSERVPIKAVVRQIEGNAELHNDSLGPHHKRHIEEAIAAAKKRGYIQVNWETRTIRVEPNTQEMLNGIKRQLKHIRDETENYYAFMALVPDTFGRPRDKTKAQLRRDLQCVKREHRKCLAHSNDSRYADDSDSGCTINETPDHYSRLSSPAYSMDSARGSDVQHRPRIITGFNDTSVRRFPSPSSASCLEDVYPSPDSPRRRTTLSAAPIATPQSREVSQTRDDLGMDQDMAIDHTNETFFRVNSSSALSPHRRTTSVLASSIPFSQSRQASQSIDADRMDEDGVVDGFQEHLKAMVKCYRHTRSVNSTLSHANGEMRTVITNLRQANEIFVTEVEEANTRHTNFVHEKKMLQDMIRTLLPSERWLEAVQNARGLVSDSAPPSGSCVR